MNATTANAELLYPLSHFFALSGEVLPPCEVIAGPAVPHSPPLPERQ